jgi:hypothetical protein
MRQDPNSSAPPAAGHAQRETRPLDRNGTARSPDGSRKVARGTLLRHRDPDSCERSGLLPEEYSRALVRGGQSKRKLLENAREKAGI